MKFLSSVILITVLISAHAYGQGIEEVELEKITITAKRVPVGLSEASENVTIVTDDEIRRLPARNLSEALNYISGVDIEPRQGFGRASAISIQGSDSRQVRVMIDGIPLNSQSSGQIDPSMFPIENISRIEIIKGASSSMWGSGLGGVVNIITKDSGKTLTPKGSFTVSFAEFHTRKEDAELSGRIEDVGYYLFSSYMESGGKGPKDDVLEKKAFGKLSYDLDDIAKITGSFGYSGADVNSGKLPDESWESQPYQLRYGKIGLELEKWDTDIRLDFKHSRLNGIRNTYLTTVDEAPYATVRTRDRLYQVSLTSGTYFRKKDLLVMGFDLDWDIFQSNLYLTEAKSLGSQAPYVNYTFKTEPMDFNLGLRYDHNSEFGEQASPCFGAVYRLKNVPETLIKACVSRAFNAPPLLWKYDEDAVLAIVSNPDLRPERAWVYELGLEHRPFSKAQIRLSLYRSDVWDAIASSLNSANQVYMKNFEKFRRQGAEMQVETNLVEGLDFLASGAFNDIENRATRKTVRGGGKARQAFGLGLEHKNKKGLGVSLKGIYNYWNEPASSQADDRKMLFDLRASQEFKNHDLFLNIYNLTNSKYCRDYYYPVPRRYLEAGTRFRW